MPDIPDIGELSPDEWLSRMQQVREQLLDEFERVWEACREPEEAAAEFAEVFEEYAMPGDSGSSGPLLAVRAEEERLVFSHETDSRDEPLEKAVAPDDEGRWKMVDAEGELGGEKEYRQLAVEMLQLVPWWSEGAFAGKVGRPEDYID